MKHIFFLSGEPPSMSSSHGGLSRSPFQLNLRTKVLNDAGITSVQPEPAIALTDTLIDDALRDRQLTTQRISHIANIVRERFNLGLPTNTSSPTQQKTQKSQRRSTGSSSVVAAGIGAHPSAAAITAAASPEGTGKVGRESASPQSPFRLLAEQRRQRASADREFHDALSKEVDAHTRDQELERERKTKQRTELSEAMHRAAAERDAAEQQRREQRVKARQEVIAEIIEVRQEELDQKERHRSKFVREKELIEEQREARRRAKEASERRKKRDDVVTRTRLTVAIQQEEQERTEYRRKVRERLIHHLDESRQELEERRQKQRDEKEHDVKLDQQNLSVLKQRPTFQDEGLKARVAESVKRYQLRQQSVEQLYVSQLEESRKQQAREAETIKRAMKDEAERIANRAFADAAQAAEKRAKLVSALDQELAIHRERKAVELKNKELYRKMAEDEATRHAALTKAEVEAKKQNQEVLRERLKCQVDEREVMRSLPLHIKVTHGSPISRRASPASAVSKPTA